jgi:cation diffusion facilitator CzcD-associated flavoprotein CzcO
MNRTDFEVAVIGAGPYGLAAAAHLKSAKVATTVFGDPMSFWQQNMPEGMWLRSPWVASHIAHPTGEYSLDAYAAMRGVAPRERMPVGEFIRYGRWFQENAVPDVDRRAVARIEHAGLGFRLHLADGDTVSVRRVVIAMGLKHQELRPRAFAGLPTDLVSHTCEHVSFEPLRNKRVAVVGRGQSACETAALLAEAGAEVELISRGEVLWLGHEQDDGGKRDDLAWKLRKLTMTRGAVGPFPLNYVAESPALVHIFPAPLRAEFNERCLRAKASGWLRARFGAVRINAGRSVKAARAANGGVTLELDNGSSHFDHVVLGTGYKIDIAKLGIIAPSLLAGIAAASGSPRLGFGMESSVPGLHFVGSTAVHSFGPLMRFVWGAGFAARSLTRAIAANRAAMAPQAAGASQTVLKARTSQSS